MDHRLEQNRRLWDLKTQHHVQSKFYDLDAFKAGRCSLNPIELKLLGKITGKRILHLQCHFGQDSISLTRHGAFVTGVDFSSRAIQVAQELASELDVSTRFVESDVLELSEVLEERFDIVFTSYGVLGWLPDLHRWARVVADSLKPGGRLVLVEFHPTLLMFDFPTGRLGYEYFAREYREVVEGTYADRKAEISSEEYCWSFSLSQVIGSLLEAGLQLQSFQEYDSSPYDCFEGMKEDRPGHWYYPVEQIRLPHLFSLVMNLPE